MEHTRFFNQMPKLWQSHLKSLEGNERKSALMLLMEIVNDNNIEICDNVIVLANNYGRIDIDSLRHCYYNLSKKAISPTPLNLSAKAPTLDYNPNLSSYDNLIGGDLYH